MEYHYTYLLTCDQHPDVKYIGVRTSKKEPRLDKYLSSSSVVRAWRSQGLTFTKHVLDEWLTREHAVEEEIRLHYLHNVSNRPDFLNRAKQTSTGFDTTGVPLSEERRSNLNMVNEKRIEDGTHNWIGNTKAKDDLANGRHNFQRNNYSRARYERGSHNFQLHRDDYVKKQLETGAHNFIADHPLKHRYVCKDCGRSNTKTVFSRNYKECLPYIERIL